jgi:hypothetical protein
MKHQISILLLVLTLCSANEDLTAFHDSTYHALGCRPLGQLNQTMETKIQFSDDQQLAVLGINKRYWRSRRQIGNQADIIGKNTAILSRWDEWRRELQSVLSTEQMETFIKWQSEVDLLGEKPF